jgi:hypothetical protein
MASVVDICNLALAHLGDEATVSAIDPADGSVQAALCSRFYPIARDTLLAHPAIAWGWAQRRATLAALAVTTEDSSVAYAVPTDYLRALAVKDCAGVSYDYIIEGQADNARVLYTSLDPAYLLYIARVTDPEAFSPGFVSTLSWLLASYLAGPITKDVKLKESAYRVYLAELGAAAVADANARRLTDHLTAAHQPLWISDR